MSETLLPPNASPLERAFDGAAGERMRPLADAPLGEVWDPERCPAALLPWLAWALSVDVWDSGWPEAVKRQAVALSVMLHRRKGTRWAVEWVLENIGALYDLDELSGQDHHRIALAVFNSGALLTRELGALKGQIEAVKRASVHYTLTLSAGIEGSVHVAGGLGAVSISRPLALTVVGRRMS